LSDYRRRVSSTATVKAFYILFAKAGCSKRTMSGIVGLAAGGKMYGSCDPTLLFVSLIS
jgi:hypothetical protein